MAYVDFELKGPYELEGPTLFMRKGSTHKEKICREGGDIAVVYDNEANILVKHGEANAVKKWLESFSKHLKKTSEECAHMADCLKIIEMPMNAKSIEFLNKCVVNAAEINAALDEISIDFEKTTTRNIEYNYARMG